MEETSRRARACVPRRRVLSPRQIRTAVAMWAGGVPAPGSDGGKRRVCLHCPPVRSLKTHRHLLHHSRQDNPHRQFKIHHHSLPHPRHTHRQGCQG